MVQKEINRKLPIYALAAILLSVLLITSIYSFSNDSLTPNQGQLNQDLDYQHSRLLLYPTKLNQPWVEQTQRTTLQLTFKLQE
jgi:hypothetical protein